MSGDNGVTITEGIINLTILECKSQLLRPKPRTYIYNKSNHIGM